MKILNDTITFDDSDFDSLSDFAKKALPLFVGERLEFKTVFADSLNKQIDQAKNVLVIVKGKDPAIEAIVRKLSAADQSKLDEAAPVLDQLTTILESVVAPAPIAFLPADLTADAIGITGKK